MMGVLKNSLLSIGRSVEVISGLHNNDDVLTPSIQSQIADSTSDFVIVEVPNAKNVCDLENLVDAENAVLVVCVASNKVTRKELKGILKGQTADKVFTIISK